MPILTHIYSSATAAPRLSPAHRGAAQTPQDPTAPGRCPSPPRASPRPPPARHSPPAPGPTCVTAEAGRQRRPPRAAPRRRAQARRSRRRGGSGQVSGEEPTPPGRRGGRGPGPARWRRGREARSGGPARRERGPRALTGPRSGWDGGPVKREGTAAAAKRKLRLPFRRNSWRRRTAAGGRRRRRKKEGRNARRHRAASRTEGGRPLLRMRTRWRRKGGSRQRGERARRGHGVRTAGWTAEGGCAAWCRSAVTLPVGWAQQKAKKKKKSRTLSVLSWESRISASAGAALPAQGPTPPQEQTSSWESLPPVTEAAVINLSRKYSTTHRRRASAAVLKVHVADDCK